MLVNAVQNTAMHDTRNTVAAGGRPSSDFKKFAISSDRPDTYNTAWTKTTDYPSTNKQRLMWLLTFHKQAMCTASVRSRNAYQRAAHHEKNVSSEGRENHIRPSFVIIMD